MKHSVLPESIAHLHHRPMVKKLLTLTRAELELMMHKFIRHNALRFKASHWLADRQPEPQVLAGNPHDFVYSNEVDNTNFFTPFVEKIVVDEGARLIIVGDVHGDIGFLVQMLEQLIKLGLLDEHYRIIPEDVYLVFVGDYINRNHHSVEVMALLFHLHRENIGSAFFVRGNHEYAISARIVYEVFAKQGTENTFLDNCLISELGTKFSMYCFPDLLAWFDYLPLGVYVGKVDQATKKTEYINFCHGGIEPAYSPRELLASDARYERITSLDRAGGMAQLLAHVGNDELKRRFQAALRRLQEIGLEQFVQSFLPGNVVDLTKPCNPRHVRLGMQWNSFLTADNDDIGIAASPRHRNLYFGSLLTKGYLELSSTDKHRVLSMMRGHQHLNEHDEVQGLRSPMLSQITAASGCLPQWGGSVYTLADSGFSADYHSFMLLTMQGSAQQWHYTHYFKQRHNVAFMAQERDFLTAE